jgi:NACalpha-BTF3-like transcription factor
MGINTRELSLTPKVAPNSKYQPMILNDANVYHLAQHYYTAEEIAERFGITRKTLMEHHSDAFNAGKDDAKNLPRFALQKIIKDFTDSELNFANPDVPVQHLLAAIKLHAQKYEGLGQKQIIEHVGNVTYDAVESKPKIIERPDK